MTQQNNKIPALFWDMDNCLIHSLYATDQQDADALIERYSELWRGEKFKISDGWYVTFLRGFSKELLSFSRQLLGNDNVYALSTGTIDYITSINHVLDLGFDPNTQMFGREDIYGYYKYPRFECTHNILIDNEDWWFHSDGKHNKVKFLNNLLESQLIQVPAFDVNYGKEHLGDFMDDLKLKITEAFFKS